MNFLLHLATLIGIYGILVTAATAAYFRGGLMSLAHAGFFGLGAYAVAVLVPVAGWPWEVAMLAGAIVAALVAALFQVTTAGLRTDVVVIASLGLQLGLSAIFLNIDLVAGGTAERVAIPAPRWLGSSPLAWLATSSLTCAATLALWSWFRNTAGWGLAAAAAGHTAWARSLGIRGVRLRACVLAASGAASAIAGSLFASFNQSIEPNSFGYTESFGILAMVLAGQMLGRMSPLVGALVFLGLPEVLRLFGLTGSEASNLLQLIFGASIVVAVLCGRLKGRAWEIHADTP